MEEIENINILFQGEELRLEVGIYQFTNHTKLQFFDKESMPYITATTDIEHVELAEDEVIIKDYGENEGILQALKEANIIEKITEKIPQGFDFVHICKLII